MIVDAHAHIFSHVCRKVAPPRFADGRFPVERLLEEMNSAGVDRALLVQNPTIGEINEEIITAVRDHPDRFAGVMQVDPRDPAAAKKVEAIVCGTRLGTLKLEMSEEWGWSGIHPGIRLTEPSMDALWGVVSRHSLKVIIDPGAIGNPGYQVEEIDLLSSHYRNVTFLLEHLGYLQPQDESNPAALERRLKLLKLAEKENVYLGFSATGALLGEEYPCPKSSSLLKEAAALVGAEKILWGTDVPITLCRYQYAQMIDVVRKETPELSATERAAILGGNAARLFFGPVRS